MTKPANFPERKRQRQLGALDRLPSAPHPKAAPGRELTLSMERQALISATINGSLRNSRTKRGSEHRIAAAAT